VAICTAAEPAARCLEELDGRATLCGEAPGWIDHHPDPMRAGVMVGDPVE
jgi:hypothetical protein